MHRGYFPLYRKFQDHPFWKERRIFSKAEAWIDILWEARYKDDIEEVIIGTKKIECRYGEIIKSIREWGTRWEWGETRVVRFLNLLKAMKQIETESEGIATRIKVLNYEQYDPKRHTNETQVKRKKSKNSGITEQQKEQQKENAEKLYDYYLEKIKPEKKSKARAISNILKHSKKYEFKDMAIAVKNYFPKGISYAPEFRKDPANFFGVNEPYFKDFMPGKFKQNINGHKPSMIPDLLTQNKLNELNT